MGMEYVSKIPDDIILKILTGLLATDKSILADLLTFWGISIPESEKEKIQILNEPVRHGIPTIQIKGEKMFCSISGVFPIFWHGYSYGRKACYRLLEENAKKPEIKTYFVAITHEIVKNDVIKDFERHYKKNYSGKVEICWKSWVQTRQFLAKALKKITVTPIKEANSLIAIGELKWIVDQHQEAIKFLKKALEIEPDNLSALKILGKIYCELSYWESAMEFTERAIKLDKDDIMLKYTLGLARWNFKGDKEAIKILEDAIEKSQSHKKVSEFLKVSESFDKFQATIDEDIYGIIGKSLAIREVRKEIENCTKNDFTVLILGERGTGKELVAQAIHKYSARGVKELIEFSCREFPQELAAGELFGHEPEAYTGANKSKEGLIEEANGSTLFIDEICDAPPEVQAMLLKVVESGKFRRLGGKMSDAKKSDFRLITATNKNIEQEIAEGRFKDDLYDRLKTIIIRTPPLRERREDIPLLINHFLEEYRKKSQQEPRTFTLEAIEALQELDYNGNIRALKGTVEKIINGTEPGENITKKKLLKCAPDFFVQKPKIPNISKRDIDKQYLEQILQKTGWNITETAKELGFHSTNSIYNRMKKFGIPQKSKRR